MENPQLGPWPLIAAQEMAFARNHQWCCPRFKSKELPSDSGIFFVFVRIVQSSHIGFE